jgi:prepilin-type N-terminal cleavage/methylation domain-containing protein
MFKSQRRSGFTLPEVLVTVAIVATLAAIVIPTVTSQMGKGDDTSVQTGLTNQRTGATAFITDLRKIPGKISHLYTKPVATDEDLFGDQYGADAVARWRGPYISGAPLADGDSLLIGFVYVRDSLVDSSLFTGTSGYIIATLAGVSSAGVAARLDTLLDAGNGDAAGILQWSTTVLADSALAKLQIMGSK